jgi:hypothetical protein
MEPVQQNLPRNSRVFDQFALMDVFGMGHLSSLAMNTLRKLLNKGTYKEGDLAQAVDTRLFRPEWKPTIEKLGELGYVSFKGTGHALARSVSLTDMGREFLADKEIVAEVEEPTEVQSGIVNA